VNTADSEVRLVNDRTDIQDSVVSFQPKLTRARTVGAATVPTHNIRRTDSVMSIDRSSAASFQLQPHQRKRQRKAFIVGKRNHQQGNFRGAPPPHRNVFLSRINRLTTCDDIKQYMNDENMNVTVHDLKCVSHSDIKFKSFVQKVDINDFDRLLDE
jgi:hypothetical protein